MRIATEIGVEGGTLSQDNFLLHWPNISRSLDSVPEIWADYYTKESLFEAVMAGAIQVWAFSEDGVIRVVLFTRLIAYPAANVLHVMIAFGNSLDRLLPQIEATLENFGQKMGCTLCEISGREGWERKLSHRFKKKVVTLVAPIVRATVN